MLPLDQNQALKIESLISQYGEKLKTKKDEDPIKQEETAIIEDLFRLFFQAKAMQSEQRVTNIHQKIEKMELKNQDLKNQDLKEIANLIKDLASSRIKK